MVTLAYEHRTVRLPVLVLRRGTRRAAARAATRSALDGAADLATGIDARARTLAAQVHAERTRAEVRAHALRAGTL